MSRMNDRRTLSGRVIATVMMGSFVLTACATAPMSPQGAADVREKLTALQEDPELSTRARTHIREAERAVVEAETPIKSKDSEIGEHRVFMADRKVEIARAIAVTRFNEDQRQRLAEERDQARLQARTLEADRAHREVERARAEAARAQSDAEAARRSGMESSAEAARLAAQASDDAERQAAELRRQIEDLEAKATERGLVVTLGDVLFATGSAELQAGPNNNLNKLVNFLNQYPQQRVLIEGHTDNVGSREFNRGLSQRRAESVRNYLTREGIASRRLSISGMGMDHPVASNDTPAGRLRNRRVEIIIEEPKLQNSSSTAE